MQHSSDTDVTVAFMLGGGPLTLSVPVGEKKEGDNYFELDAYIVKLFFSITC